MTNILLRRRKLGNDTCRGIQAVSTTGLQMLRNDSPFPSELNFVFRWGCTSTIPNRQGVTIVNKASAVHWCSNKKQGRLDMQAAGVSVPETWDARGFVTMSAYDNDYTEDSFVLRRAQHSQGRDLWHGSMDEIVQAISANNVSDGYVATKIDKVAEYRVMVVQNRVAWVAQKTPGNPEDVAWNVARGGRFDNVRWDNWPIAVIKEALAAAKVAEPLGLTFCGVDVMVDGEGVAFVLEVNSAPSQTSPYRQQCVAKAFDHIVTSGKDHFPDPSRFRNYKDVIHPAVRGPANA